MKGVRGGTYVRRKPKPTNRQLVNDFVERVASAEPRLVYKEDSVEL